MLLGDDPGEPGGGEPGPGRPLPAEVYRRIRRAADPPVRIAMTAPRTAAFVARSWARSRQDAVTAHPPTPPPSAGLAAQVALDELLLAMMKSPKRYPHRADYERVGQEVLEAADLFERRGGRPNPRPSNPTRPRRPRPPSEPSAPLTLPGRRGSGTGTLRSETATARHPTEPGRHAG